MEVLLSQTHLFNCVCLKMYNVFDGSKYILENKFEVAYLFWIVLNNRRLVNEYVFLGVVSVDESVSGFYVKPFDGA